MAANKFHFITQYFSNIALSASEDAKAREKLTNLGTKIKV
jgi:hypothetical protein